MGKNNKIDKQELAVCKRRGHNVHLSEGWAQCSYCRMWLREVRTIEERVDEPPEEELSYSTRTDRSLERIKEMNRKARKEK